MDEVLARLKASGGQVNETDGARVNTPDGWWLLRASNTQDVLVARAEAKNEAGLERLMHQIDGQLAESGLTRGPQASHRSEEHTSELQSLMRISYAVFCLEKKKTKLHTHIR